MHGLFLEDCQRNNMPKVSSITYRRIFCKEYNFSFFKPKKDQCMTCSEYEKAAPEERTKLEQKYQMHLERKDAAMKEKEADKQRATDENGFISISCDMQSVLHIPTSEISLLYYLRKLNLYNFTIYESAPPNDAFCYFWTEVNGKRGSCEIGTCLSLYIQSLTENRKNVMHLTIFSDTCGGQNRNIQVAAVLLHTVQCHPTLDVIEQKFMESGHSYMEVDSMHSSIETAKHKIDIFSVHEYENIFRMARKNRKGDKSAYKTREIEHNEFLDLKKLAQMMIINKNKDFEGNTVNWLNVKCFRYQKQLPNVIQ
ncbi:uncharacterized protein [Diabrotica undecimpunctata]|uniref:uncharacterized protein n=1 Tax=Diabrotica undecimpunctata TaxID=50387 RepID=UPI003B63837C